MTAPKLFISYSWTTPQHEQWVLDLAEELVQSGVDVILDKWDLKEGHDAIVFMEKMVNDENIKKVLIICDKKYVEKANNRSGGVGTEAQIMSAEIYNHVSQDKFVAVVREKDENRQPYLPTYYKGKIYIDLSESERYAENFEVLVRWIYDKPLYKKPELGKMPAFLSEEEHISLGTTALFKRCIDAIKNQKPFAIASLNEYLQTFAQHVERFRITRNEEDHGYDGIVKNIDEFIPHRNEALQLFFVIAQYSPTEEAMQTLHRFFEKLVPYTMRSNSSGVSYETDQDNFKFIVHELFLYAIAVFLRYEKFDQARYLLQGHYYIPGNSEYGRNEMVDFTVFRGYLKSMEIRNQRLNLRRLSLHADLLKERNKASGVEFRDLMQADFVAFMCGAIQTDDYNRWWPETLVYMETHSSTAFEIFARSISKSYFDKVKVLFGIKEKTDLYPIFESYQKGERQLPRWEYRSVNAPLLFNYDKIGTKP